MKKGTKTLLILSSLVLILALPTKAFAAPELASSTISSELTSSSLRWTNIEKFTPILSISGNTLTSGVYVNASDSSAKISGVYTLEKKSGTAWSAVKSWNFSGVATVSSSQAFTGIKGAEYRTKAVATVNGETVTNYSKTYKVN